jgi:hypothetical protein
MITLQAQIVSCVHEAMVPVIVLYGMSLSYMEWQKWSWKLLHEQWPFITNFSMASCLLLVSHKLLILPSIVGDHMYMLHLGCGVRV